MFLVTPAAVWGKSSTPLVKADTEKCSCLWILLILDIFWCQNGFGTIHWRSADPARQRINPGGDFRASPHPPASSIPFLGTIRRCQGRHQGKAHQEIGFLLEFSDWGSWKSQYEGSPTGGPKYLEYLRQGKFGCFWTKELILKYKVANLMKCNYSVQDQNPRMKRSQGSSSSWGKLVWIRKEKCSHCFGTTICQNFLKTM